jgi:hypothetical protein
MSELPTRTADLSGNIKSIATQAKNPRQKGIAAASRARSGNDSPSGSFN